MKKTLTVNISGIVFHIDEDAYEVLNNYLQSIKKHFIRVEGGDEIISDIEARIAEMLKERIGNERQVITIDDIEVVIQVIGQPSEFGEEFAENEPGSQKASGKETKRLYRDPERSVLGGVCGGMGAYFNTDPVWFRLAFVLLCIPGIGTPLLIYVVLWIVIPEARTAADRLEMKGEKVNISNIENSIREEISNLKNKINNFTEGAKRTYKKKSAAHKSDFEGVGNALGRVTELFVKVVLVFAGIILFIIGISIILAFLAVIFGFGHDIFIIDSELVYVSFQSLIAFFIGSAGNSVIFQTAFVLLVGIPLFMLVYAGIKLIFGIDRTRFVGITAFNIWIVALLVSGYFGFKTFRSFSHTGVHQESVKTEIPVDQMIRMEVVESEKFNRYYRYDEYYHIDEANMIITNDVEDFFYGIPNLEIVKSSGSEIEVELYYRARGKSDYHATNRAERTVYNYTIEGSVFSFDQFFKLPNNEVWREQEVDVVVKLPVGCKVYVAENMEPIINSYQHSPYRLSGDTWVMTDSGLEETEILPDEIMEDESETEEQPTAADQNQTRVHAENDIFGILYNGFLSLFGYTV